MRLLRSSESSILARGVTSEQSRRVTTRGSGRWRPMAPDGPRQRVGRRLAQDRVFLYAYNRIVYANESIDIVSILIDGYR